MFRCTPILIPILSLSLTTACLSEADDVEQVEQPLATQVSREHVTADIYHYEFVIPVGSTANAAIRLHRVVRERAPFRPRRTSRAAMLLHGDFATFETNFAPSLGEPAGPDLGLAPYLAADGFDVWGLDRRWTLPAPDGDISDFADMGAAQATSDLEIALSVARTTRLLEGSGGGRLGLIGFSRGAQLAYTYAALEGARPAFRRHVDAIVPLDFYADLGPEQADLRATFCQFAAFEYQLVADGVVDSPNELQIVAAQLARTAPDDPSPLFEGLTNLQTLHVFVGQTYNFVPFSPLYHLLAPDLEDGFPVGLAETSEEATLAWLEGAPFHQALLEAADFDGLLCGDEPLAVPASLADIRVPVLYIGAAGGVGELGDFTASEVSSSDVTTMLISRFGPEDAASDFGHADLLFADDAPSLVWDPLIAWLSQR